MQADAWAVLALMLGFLAMIGVGVWARLEDETRAGIALAKGRLLAGLGAAAAGLLALLVAQ